MSTSAASPTPLPIVTLAHDIKLSHSVFALPFALLATFLAAGAARRLPDLWTLLLIVVCMVLARTVAMTVNRLADAKLDAGNPRTKGRAIPAGKLSRSFMLSVLVACAIGFILATSGFYFRAHNPWPLILSPVALGWLSFYSFTKRFTWLCHLWLGTSLALSPIAAVVAVNPAYMRSAEPYLLFAMVTCWVGAFDIIYALQDVGVDKEQGLFSMPAKLGVEPALWISRLMHALCIVALVMLTWHCPLLDKCFNIGIALAIALLVLEHALVWKSKTHHINMAFFTVNGIISLLLGGLGIADVVMRMRS